MNEPETDGRLSINEEAVSSMPYLRNCLGWVSGLGMYFDWLISPLPVPGNTYPRPPAKTFGPLSRITALPQKAPGS